MKLKNILLILGTVVFAFSAISPVFALTTKKNDYSDYYIRTMTGVELTKSQYDNLSRIYSYDTIITLDQEIIDSFKNATNLEKIEYVEYIKVTTTYLEKTPVQTNETKISKNEYDNVNIEKVKVENSLFAITMSSAYYETTYKKITLTLAYYSFGISDKSVTLHNEWKIIPAIKTFDIIAIAFDQNFGTFMNNRSGYQKYDGNLINYSANNSNFKPSGGFLGIYKSGVSLSQNIVDSTTNTLENSLTIKFTTSAIPTVRATYQHATCSSITLANSHDWVYSTEGMGGIVKFNNTSVKNCYDNTPGLVATFPY